VFACQITAFGLSEQIGFRWICFWLTPVSGKPWRLPHRGTAYNKLQSLPPHVKAKRRSYWGEKSKWTTTITSTTWGRDGKCTFSNLQILLLPSQQQFTLKHFRQCSETDVWNFRCHAEYCIFNFGVPLLLTFDSRQNTSQLITAASLTKYWKNSRLVFLKNSQAAAGRGEAVTVKKQDV